MPDPFTLDTAIALWRRRYENDRTFLDEDIRELEQHVRDHVAARVAEGGSASEAFLEVMRDMGEHEAVRAAYREVRWGKLRRNRSLGRELKWRLSMLGNYLKIALRTLRRRTGYSFLNVTGLALGMACCLLLFQYVAFETSYDRFHTKHNRIVRAAFHTTQDGVDQGVSALVGYRLAEVAAEEVPGIARYARVHPNYGEAILSHAGPDGERTFAEPGALFVDSTFFQLFDFPLLQGEPSQALRQPKTLLLSASTARKYFGDAPAVGKSVAFPGWIEGIYTVAGVFADVPPNAHFTFDVLLPLGDLLGTGRFDGGDLPWGWQNFVTYFELAPGADRAAVEAGLTRAFHRHRREALARSGRQATAYLQPLADIHLNPDVFSPWTTGDRRMVYFFTVIGLITLVIALVNYVNLATARATDRGREVGVRKVVGAQRRQLVGQFLMESALVNALALGLAVGLSLALLPVINRVAGVEMPRSAVVVSSGRRPQGPRGRWDVARIAAEGAGGHAVCGLDRPAGGHPRRVRTTRLHAGVGHRSRPRAGARRRRPESTSRGNRLGRRDAIIQA